MLKKNCAEHGIIYHDLQSEGHGIVHIIGPELGLTQPGMTIVCGDSHTSTHGAFGAIAFGIGTSEVEMVLASQCIMQPKPKKMRINVNGDLTKELLQKILLCILFLKFQPVEEQAILLNMQVQPLASLSMEGRMTLCNLSIESGARGGMIAPDDITINYVKGREFAPKGEEWDKAVNTMERIKIGRRSRIRHRI